MAKPIVVSISHSIDPDGIGSQAILFRYFRELQIEPIAYLADYNNFKETVEKALTHKPNVLIISDIGINKSYLADVIDLLRESSARKIWIDHHKISVEDWKSVVEIVDEFITDTTVCAAELVQRRFMPNDEISKKIAKIGHDGDFDVKNRLTDIFYTLIDYHRFSTEKLEKIRDYLIQGDFEDSGLITEYLDAYKVFEAERDRIKLNVKELTIAEKTIAIADSALLPRGKVTKFLSEISQADILMAIDTNNFRIGLRSENFDVAALAMEFNGGGHRHRSGFTYKEALDSDGNLNDDFLEKVKTAIEKISKEQNV